MERENLERIHSQLKGFVVLGSPAVVFGFRCELPLLIGEHWADQVNVHERPEQSGSLPLHIVHSDH